jgi:hypothetical protein
LELTLIQLDKKITRYIACDCVDMENVRRRNIISMHAY